MSADDDRPIDLNRARKQRRFAHMIASTHGRAITAADMAKADRLLTALSEAADRLIAEGR
jgi:hypothetical protein